MGGGGGGPIDSIINGDFNETIGEIAGIALAPVTAGASIVGRRTANDLVDTVSGKKVRDYMTKEKQASMDQEASNAKKMADQEAKQDAVREFSTKRARQRSMMGANQGRGSTILTSPLGSPGGGSGSSGKTLLGS